MAEVFNPRRKPQWNADDLFQEFAGISRALPTALRPLAYSALPTGSGSWDSGSGTTITVTRALAVGGNMGVSGVAAFGSASLDATVGVGLTRSVNTASTEYGVKISHTQAGAGSAYGIQNYVTHSGAASSASYDGKITSSGSGNRDHIIAMQLLTQHSSTGTMVDALGIETNLTISDSCATTNAIGVQVDAPNLLGSSGTRVTNLYGIRVNDQTHARATNIWAIRTLGTVQSQFGGPVLIDPEASGLQIGANVQIGGTSGIAASKVGFYGANASTFNVVCNGNTTASFDQSSTARDTRFLIWDVDNAALERVTVGIADSGGAGFKVLRIPN